MRRQAVEVIILDNGSTDLTAALLARLRGAKVIRNSENMHYLRGVNRAAREAGGDYLLLLNNDAQLFPGTLDAAVATISVGGGYRCGRRPHYAA